MVNYPLSGFTKEGSSTLKFFLIYILGVFDSSLCLTAGRRALCYTFPI